MFKNLIINLFWTFTAKTLLFLWVNLNFSCDTVTFEQFICFKQCKPTVPTKYTLRRKDYKEVKSHTLLLLDFSSV